MTTDITPSANTGNQRYSRKVTVLISRIEQDCRQNIDQLIKDGRLAAEAWGVDWASPCWDVRKVFAHTKRSHRSERHAMNLWFTERASKPKTPGAPFETTFGEIVRSLVVLRHQAGNQGFVDQQQVIIASQFIYHQLEGRGHDVMAMTPGDLDRACLSISATQSASTAYKLHRFVEEIAATIDRNRLCPLRLNFRYAGKKRPSSVNGLGGERLDDPDLGKYTSSKMVSEDVMRALGHLYQTIPDDCPSDRLLINVVVIAACTGRRIGEILTLPAQHVKRDSEGYAYLHYYKEKRSQGCQTIVKEKLYLIPQTVHLVESAIDEVFNLTKETRAAARRIAANDGPDTSGWPTSEYLSTCDVRTSVGLSSESSARAWLRHRGVPVEKMLGYKNLYKYDDVLDGMRKDLYEGPAVHVTPPAKDLPLHELLFIAFWQAFHSDKATLRYAVWPINVRHISDFLGARGSGAFKRYFSGEAQAGYRINTHAFRHYLNTLLTRGGMSDTLQTEWFGRKNPADTKAYQHLSEAERTAAVREFTAGRFTGEAMPLKPSSHAEENRVAQNVAVLDVGPGWCQHDWRSDPCPRHLEAQVDPASLAWVGGDAHSRRIELERMRSITQSVLDLATQQLTHGTPNADVWIDHLRIRLDMIVEALGKQGASGEGYAAHE